MLYEYNLFLQMRLKNRVLEFYFCSRVLTYLFHHRAKCKNTDVHEDTAPYHFAISENEDNGALSVTTSSVTMAMILCFSLLLIPCKCSLSFHLVLYSIKFNNGTVLFSEMKWMDDEEVSGYMFQCNTVLRMPPRCTCNPGLEAHLNLFELKSTEVNLIFIFSVSQGNFIAKGFFC